MSSVGTVAVATGGDPSAVSRLATTDPAVALFSALAVLHRSPGGSVAVASQRGTPSASLTTLIGPSGRVLTAVLDHGGADIVGLFGHGEQRRLALAEGAPSVPGGYVVYAEIPLPEGTILKSGFSGLQYALYDGRSTNGPVLFATTKSLPFTGQLVSQPMNLDDLDTTLSPALRVPTSSLSLAPVVRWSGLCRTCCPGFLEDWRSSSAFSPHLWSKRPPAARTKP